MRSGLVLTSSAFPDVELRSAAVDDCDRLRTWKNDHRQFFFFHDVITPEGQLAWFHRYESRADDVMFMVVVDAVTIGCMAVRRIDQRTDVYNVILGLPEYGGRGVMSKAFRLMCSYAPEHLEREVVALVLKENPAVGWYVKCGFDIAAEEQSHYFIRLSPDRFSGVPVEIRQDVP